MKSVMFKRSALAIAFLLAVPMIRAESLGPLRLGKVLIPSSFASALRDGLSVPVQLRYQDAAAGTDALTDDPVGSATLVLKNDAIYLLNMVLMKQPARSKMRPNKLAW